jgi:hypothetical protein
LCFVQSGKLALYIEKIVGLFVHASLTWSVCLFFTAPMSMHPMHMFQPQKAINFPKQYCLQMGHMGLLQYYVIGFMNHLCSSHTIVVKIQCSFDY